MDPELAPAYEIYRMVGLGSTDFSPDNITSIRTQLDEFMAAAQDELPDSPNVTSSDHVAPGPDGYDVPVRVYWPTAQADDIALPAIYFIHGGGMVLGTLDASDPACQAYVDQVG